MEYKVKAHPTKYGGVLYRSRLEARWAAFFDLAGWKHEYEPIDFPRWSPDFRVEFDCYHSECPPTHILFVEVKPYWSIGQFKNHESSRHLGCGIGDLCNYEICDSSGQFGANTEVTHWSMGHGSGGGDEELSQWVENHIQLWKDAGLIVQYNPKGGE